MANNGNDNTMALGASNDAPSREGPSSAPNASGSEQDPDQGTDMSNTEHRRGAVGPRLPGGRHAERARTGGATAGHAQHYIIAYRKRRLL